MIAVLECDVEYKLLFRKIKQHHTIFNHKSRELVIDKLWSKDI